MLRTKTQNSKFITSRTELNCNMNKRFNKILKYKTAVDKLLYNKYKVSVIILINIAFTFFLTDSLNAQVKNSIYTMFGVGQLIDKDFGVNKSLGGTGIAFQSGRSINYSNPASYLGIFPNSFNMELGVYGVYNKSENKNASQTDADINFSYFSANFYVTEWWASGFGIIPFSYVDYKINSTDQIGGELTTYEKSFSGKGRLNQIYLGNSFEIYDGLTVGFNASYIFGLITQTETAVENSSLAEYVIKNERSAHNFYLDYGLQYSLNYNSWKYTVGLIYASGKKLNTSDDLTFTYSGATDTLKHDEPKAIQIPQKLGIGISLNNNNNFRAGFDYQWQDWSGASFANPNLDTKNSNRFSIGIEYSPGQNKNSDSWLNTLIYRLGTNYNSSYLKIDNTPINSMGLTLGVGIPYDRTNTINFSVEYGEEGTLNKGLIKNSYFMFYLNISMYEFWSTLPLHN